MNEIKIVSAPVIEYSAIDQIAEEVKKELATYDINAIVPTDENHQFLKKLRTEYKKKFDEYENARKFIKQTVNGNQEEHKDPDGPVVHPVVRLVPCADLPLAVVFDLDW